MRRRAKGAIGTGALAVGAVGAMGLFALFGCGSDSNGVANAKLPEGMRSQAIEHESCEESGHKVETVDVNNDGKPDIRRVYKDNREICRISDLNRDGKPDMFEYYDQTGQLRRREADYDDNGIVNAIEFYENGKLVRAELDTTNQGRIDTWDYFDPGTGKRTKRERDTTADGRIDQWWTYEGDKVSIAMDRNGDGHPELDSTVVLGSGGTAVMPVADAGVASEGEAGAAPPVPEPATLPPASPEQGPTVAIPDAGVPGKPTRGGAKR